VIATIRTLRPRQSGSRPELRTTRLALTHIATLCCFLAGFACEQKSGPVAEAEAWQEKACACNDDACEAELNDAANALARRVGPELKSDAQRIEYGKAMATGQGCLRKARSRR
jgi:hypothetical protein